MDDVGFQRGADHAVQTRLSGVGGIVQHHLIQRLPDQQLLLHTALVSGGQLRHGDEQGTGAVRAGQTLQRGGHHGLRAGGMEIDHVHVQRGQRRHGLFDRVGDIVQLQIQKDAVAPGTDLPYNGGSLGVEQLHADLHKGLLLREAVQKGQCLVFAVKVQCDDNVLTHDVRLL